MDISRTLYKLEDTLVIIELIVTTLELIILSICITAIIANFLVNLFGFKLYSVLIYATLIWFFTVIFTKIMKKLINYIHSKYIERKWSKEGCPYKRNRESTGEEDEHDSQNAEPSGFNCKVISLEEKQGRV